MEVRAAGHLFGDVAQVLHDAFHHGLQLSRETATACGE